MAYTRPRNGGTGTVSAPNTGGGLAAASGTASAKNAVQNNTYGFWDVINPFSPWFLGFNINDVPGYTTLVNADKSVVNTAEQLGSDIAAPFEAAAGAVSDLSTFLKFIAWMFTPVNLLRVAEGATGLMLLILGLASMLKRQTPGSGITRQFITGATTFGVERERTRRHYGVERERTSRQLQVEAARTRRKQTKAP